MNTETILWSALPPNCSFDSFLLLLFYSIPSSCHQSKLCCQHHWDKAFSDGRYDSGMEQGVFSAAQPCSQVNSGTQHHPRSVAHLDQP